MVHVRSARLLLTALSLGSSLLSFLSYTLLLRQLGASAQVDALFYAASVPVGTAGLVTAVLVYLLPTRLTELPQTTQEGALRQLARWVSAATAVALAAVVIAAQASGEHDQQRILMLCGFIVHAGLSVVGTLMVCRAQAAGRYILAGMNQFLLMTGLVFGVATAVALHRVEWVMLGQLAGAAVALPLMAKRLALKGLLRTRWRGDGRALREVLTPLKPHLLHIVVASTAFTMFQPIDAHLCQQLGDGAVSIMAFAQRAWVASAMLISLGAHTIAARTARDAFEAGGAVGLKMTARREVARIMLAGGAVWIAYVLIGHSLLAMLLQSGTLPQSNLQLMLDCISWMLLSAPAMAAIPYLFRVQYTLNDYRWPAYIGGTVPLIYATVASFLIPHIGLGALPLALGVAWWLALLATMIALHRTHSGPKTPPTVTPAP